LIESLKKVNDGENIFLVHKGILSSTTCNDLAAYSNNSKHLKFTDATTINNLLSFDEAIGTPVRLDANRFATPTPVQRRRALGLVNHNCNHNNQQTAQFFSSDDLPFITSGSASCENVRLKC
jgi:hypothetical protein